MTSRESKNSLARVASMSCDHFSPVLNMLTHNSRNILCASTGAEVATPRHGLACHRIEFTLRGPKKPRFRTMPQALVVPSLSASDARRRVTPSCPVSITLRSPSSGPAQEYLSSPVSWSTVLRLNHSELGSASAVTGVDHTRSMEARLLQYVGLGVRYAAMRTSSCLATDSDIPSPASWKSQWSCSNKMSSTLGPTMMDTLPAAPAVFGSDST
mmetsp:Transcript_11246/g.32090  ORF Transcript_11246/g.32090 Transcript_11246/m.32090 type:complete len:213 (+) Transcript_11246:197-835(+)